MMSLDTWVPMWKSLSGRSVSDRMNWSSLRVSDSSLALSAVRPDDTSGVVDRSCCWESH